MSVGIISIACMPGYATIGLVAPLLVMLGRLLQGFSAGMELGGVSVYLSEIATPGHKGFYVSWQSASQQVAVMFAALIGVVLSSLLPPQKMMLWGWRVPLLLGCAIIPFLFRLRRSLQETDEFVARKHKPSISEILQSLTASWQIVIIGTMLATMTTVSFYMITAYTPTFGNSVLHLASIDSLIVTLCVGASNLFWLPVMGALSDRVGRRPLLLVCTTLMLVTAYPVMLWLVGATIFLEVARGRTLAVFHLRQLQRRHGRFSDRDHAGQRADLGFCARLQPRHRHLRWLHARHQHVSDSRYRKPRGSRDCGCPSLQRAVFWRLFWPDPPENESGIQPARRCPTSGRHHLRRAAGSGFNRCPPPQCTPEV